MSKYPQVERVYIASCERFSSYRELNLVDSHSTKIVGKDSLGDSIKERQVNTEKALQYLTQVAREHIRRWGHNIPAEPANARLRRRVFLRKLFRRIPT